MPELKTKTKIKIDDDVTFCYDGINVDEGIVIGLGEGRIHVLARRLKESVPAPLSELVGPPRLPAHVKERAAVLKLWPDQIIHHRPYPPANLQSSL
jgi:hypothetical protein